MSRSKHQTLNGIIRGQSKSEVKANFDEGDHDAMEWLAKRRIKKETLRDRNAAKDENREPPSEAGQPSDGNSTPT